MHVIDNLIQSGVKTLSTLLGRRGAGQTESYAKIEIKLYLTGLGVSKSTLLPLWRNCLLFI